MKLEGKIAVITGGNSGIGFATAERYAQEGAHVVITGRRAEAVQEAVAKLGDRATGFVGDAADLGDIDRLIEQVKTQHGRIDVLFLNAGVAPMAPAAEVDEATFDHVMDINVKGPFFTIQKALPLLSEGASVLINASVVTYKGFAGMSVYSASKGAIRTLVRVLAQELAPQGIRVNALSPGPIETPIWGKTGVEQSEDDGAAMLAALPLSRFGKPEEMASAALFLGSNESSYVTGADLQADGGFAQV